MTPQVPLGNEFQVNTYTTSASLHSPSRRTPPATSSWPGSATSRTAPDGIFARRYLASGAPVGASEFRVNAHPAARVVPDVASNATGRPSSSGQATARMVTADGVLAGRAMRRGARGTEFRVNNYTTHIQARATVAMDVDGNFVVVWASYGMDGSRGLGPAVQRAGSAPEAAEFRVNRDTTGAAASPYVAWMTPGISWWCGERPGRRGGVVASSASGSTRPGVAQRARIPGEFVYDGLPAGHRWPWTRTATSSCLESDVEDGSCAGIFARRFNARGLHRAEFPVNQFTTVRRPVLRPCRSGSGRRLRRGPGTWTLLDGGDCGSSPRGSTRADRRRAGSCLNTYTPDEQGPRRSRRTTAAASSRRGQP